MASLSVVGFPPPLPDISQLQREKTNSSCYFYALFSLWQLLLYSITALGPLPYPSLHFMQPAAGEFSFDLFF